MRVIIHITNGSQAGRKAALGPQRELKVGRSEWADLVCDDDAKMSRVHFRLETNAFGCCVEDLKSSNGTYVNEQRIEEKIVLHSGDRVRAGQTEFDIVIEGDVPEAAETLNQEEAAAIKAQEEARRIAQMTAIRQSVLRGEKEMGYVAREVPSGLKAFTPSAPPGEHAAVEAARLTQLLARTASEYVLVDPLKAAEVRGEEFAESKVVYDWLPAEAARQRSPFLVPSKGVGSIPDLFDRAWGHNAMVVFVTTAGFDEFLGQLRKAIRPETDGMLGLCWPTVLSGLLTAGDGKLLENQLAGVQCVLLEDADHDYAWMVIAKSEFAEVLDGFEIGAAE